MKRQVANNRATVSPEPDAHPLSHDPLRVSERELLELGEAATVNLLLAIKRPASRKRNTTPLLPKHPGPLNLIQTSSCS